MKRALVYFVCVCSFIAVQKKTHFTFCYDTKNMFGPHNYWMEAKEKNVALIYLKVFRSFNSLHNFDWKDAPC